MPAFTMRCSVCDKTFELDRPALPVEELAPQHTAVYRDQRRGEVPCAGTAQRFIPLPG